MDAAGTQAALDDRSLVLARCGKAMRKVTAGEPRPDHARLPLAIDQVEIAGAGGVGTLDHPIGDGGNGRVKLSHNKGALTPWLLNDDGMAARD